MSVAIVTERELLPETDLVGGSERPRVIFSTELAGEPLLSVRGVSAGYGGGDILKQGRR